MKKILTAVLLISTSLGVLIGAEELTTIEAPPSNHVLVTTVMTDRGLYNLSVWIKFESPAIISGRMTKYNLDTYSAYITHLNKLWKQTVFNTVNKPTIKVSELDSLKNDVCDAILQLIKDNRSRFKISKDYETLFSISHFFLSEV